MTSLLNLLDSEEYGRATRYELLRFGRHPEELESGSMSWDDFKLIVEFAPIDSPLVLKQNPDAVWGLGEQLLAEAVDTLHWLKWAKTEGAKHKQGMPEPIGRPGVDKPEVIGSDPVDYDQVDDLIGWDL